MKKVIITGANGFVGSRLVKEMSDASVLVYAVVKDERENIESISNLNGVHIIYCNMSEYDTLANKIAIINGGVEVDVFFHFAWAGVSGEDQANFEVQLDNIYYSCKAFLSATEMKVLKFVYAASIHEYEIMKQFEKNPSEIKYRQIYSAAKISAHLMLSCLANNSKVNFCSVIISNIFGPGEMSSRLINSTIRGWLTENTASFTHARQLYDFIYIDDAVKGIVKVGELGVHGRNYYLGSCRIMPLRQYLEIFKEIVNKKAKMKLNEIPFNGESLTYSEFDVNLLYMDTGFKTETSFEDGIMKTTEWIKKQLLQ